LYQYGQDSIGAITIRAEKDGKLTKEKKIVLMLTILPRRNPMSYK
jgi:hypothetical protein